MNAGAWRRDDEILTWPDLDDGGGYIATVGPTVRHADPRCVEARGYQSWVPADDGVLGGRWLGDLPVCRVCAPRRQQQVCPSCHLAMPLTGVCADCG